MVVGAGAGVVGVAPEGVDQREIQVVDLPQGLLGKVRVHGQGGIAGVPEDVVEERVSPHHTRGHTRCTRSIPLNPARAVLARTPHNGSRPEFSVLRENLDVVDGIRQGNLDATIQFYENFIATGRGIDFGHNAGIANVDEVSENVTQEPCRQRNDLDAVPDLKFAIPMPGLT